MSDVSSSDDVGCDERLGPVMEGTLAIIPDTYLNSREGRVDYKYLGT